MTKHQFRRNKRSRGTNKPRGCRLRFECCEDRLSLSATPASEWVASLQANLEAVPLELGITLEVTDANSSANNTAVSAIDSAATENAAPANNADNHFKALLTPDAVEHALLILQPGEGGFERLRLTDGLTAWTFDSIADFTSSDRNHGADAQTPRNDDSNASGADESASLVDTRSVRDQVFVLMDSIDVSEPGGNTAKHVVGLSVSNGSLRLVTAEFNEQSPPITMLEIGEVKADEPQSSTLR